MNARYNGYFYANQYINDVYQSLEEKYAYNFNDVLKVFPEIDSGTVNGNKEKLDDAFKKASQTIEWYKSSDWTDDSYILIGKIRHLRAQFQYAIETFQYVNQTSKDPAARQQALIGLMRTYMDMGDMDKALEVSNYLQLEEEITEDNNLDYKLLLAYYHQLEENETGMFTALEEVNEVIKNRDQKARTNFILGQLAQKEGKNVDAIDYYNLALKGNPPYELVFHSQLNKMSLADFGNASEDQVEKVYKIFDKLLKDGKNLEYQDKIYYVWGILEQRRERLQVAMRYYKVGTQVEQPDTRQQGLLFLRLGELYFEPFQNYQQASLNYDSAVAKLPNDEAGYEKVVEKQLVLKDFVTQLNTIALNDSLLALAELNSVQLDAFLEQYIVAEEAKKKAEEKKKKRSEGAASSGIVASANTDTSGDDTWYFYNQAAIDQGQLEFRRVWGNRPLEDDWRRSTKISSNDVAKSLATESTETDVQQVEEDPSRSEEFASQKQALLETIPTSTEAKKQAYLAMEEAYFNLGRIYLFGLTREGKSVESYETLLSRFPNTEFKLEALFSLYTIFKDKDVARAEGYKNRIIADFPESLTAKILINPNYVEEKEARNIRLQQRYAEAYGQYEAGNYVEADQMIRNALSSFEDVDFLPTVELLSAILKAKTEGLFAYEKSLNDFMTKYSEGPLVDYAKSLVDALKPTKVNILGDRGFDFSEDFQKLHLIAVTVDTTINSVQKVLDIVNGLNEEKFKNQRLATTSLPFRKNTNIAIIYVNSFKTKSASQRYRDILAEVLNEAMNKDDVNFHNFAISIDNFQFLFDNEKIEAYKAFHEKFYK
ncbi:tetratricopeptide repeat protein [Roseivirga sp.]|uniref:type IX secretion system periplasmic lipoprotein PorW/SprE n=1 Tax=Roseivirga sp. TaxID=1964215 RepID=UPI003B8BFE7D